MTQRFSHIFELNLSISLLQLQLRAHVSLLHVKIDKRKQECSDNEDFETPDAGGNTKKKPKMHEGAAAAFLQKQKKTERSKKQPRRVTTTSISADVRALREDDDVVTMKHPHRFLDETDADVAAWERGIAQLVSSSLIFIRTIVHKRPANTQRTLSARSVNACVLGLHGLQMFFQAAYMVFEDILVPAHYLQ